LSAGAGAAQYAQDSQYSAPRQVAVAPAGAAAPAGSQYGVPRSDYGPPANQALPAQPQPLQPNQAPLPMMPAQAQQPLQPMPIQAAPGYAQDAGGGPQWGATQPYPGAALPADGGYPGPQVAGLLGGEYPAGATGYSGGPVGYPAGQEAYPRSAGAPPEEESFAPDACRTLYVDNLPGDATKREVAHIFRAFEGFQARTVTVC